MLFPVALGCSRLLDAHAWSVLAHNIRHTRPRPPQLRPPAAPAPHSPLPPQGPTNSKRPMVDFVAPVYYEREAGTWGLHGPTLRVVQGDTVKLRLANNLTRPHASRGGVSTPLNGFTRVADTNNHAHGLHVWPGGAATGRRRQDRQGPHQKGPSPRGTVAGAGPCHNCAPDSPPCPSPQALRIRGQQRSIAAATTSCSACPASGTRGSTS